jgi:hypothetical protein
VTKRRRNVPVSERRLIERDLASGITRCTVLTRPAEVDERERERRERQKTPAPSVDFKAFGARLKKRRRGEL